MNFIHSFIQICLTSVVDVAKSERCELVLNAVFYWGPVKFFQNGVPRAPFVV